MASTAGLSIDSAVGPLAGAAAPAEVASVRSRIASIDVMRGLVIVIMLLDHVREAFFAHVPVGDPMDVEATEPALFAQRLAAHLCAPTFVFLTGLGAWLYANPASGAPRSASGFLIKRGLLLIFLELTVINLAWYGDVQIRSLRPLGRVREPGDDARVSASHRRRLRRLRSPQSFDAVTLPSRSRRPRAAR